MNKPTFNETVSIRINKVTLEVLSDLKKDFGTNSKKINAYILDKLEEDGLIFVSLDGTVKKVEK